MAAAASTPKASPSQATQPFAPEMDSLARYLMAIAQHHDNFDCWDSKYHEWNPVETAARRNVIGEWEKIARANGIRFGASEHLGASWNCFGVSHRSDTTGALAGVLYDGTNPEWASLYHNGDKDSDWGSWYKGAPIDFRQERLRRKTDLPD